MVLVTESDSNFREELLHLLSSIDRKLDLLINKTGGRRVSGDSKDEIWEQLEQGFLSRRLNGVDPVSDKFWITSEKNLARCKRLGMDPMKVLEELNRRLGD